MVDGSQTLNGFMYKFYLKIRYGMIANERTTKRRPKDQMWTITVTIQPLTMNKTHIHDMGIDGIWYVIECHEMTKYETFQKKTKKRADLF